jgi:hypothetical protein
MAEMFRGLGYNAEVVGGANDGGIDAIAHKDGKRYYIQCKKFITREVTPHGCAGLPRRSRMPTTRRTGATL